MLRKLSAVSCATIAMLLLAAPTARADAQVASAVADPGDIMSDTGGPTTSTLFATAGSLADSTSGVASTGSGSAGDPTLVASDAAGPDVGAPAGDTSPDVVYGADGRTRVTNTTAYPYRAEVAISSSVGRCSGSLVAPTVVITAAHCMVDSNGDWATSVHIWPGRNATSTPYGECGTKATYAPRGYVEFHYQSYDYSVIKLNCSIGNTVGWLVMTAAGVLRA